MTYIIVQLLPDLLERLPFDLLLDLVDLPRMLQLHLHHLCPMAEAPAVHHDEQNDRKADEQKHAQTGKDNDRGDISMFHHVEELAVLCRPMRRQAIPMMMNLSTQSTWVIP